MSTIEIRRYDEPPTHKWAGRGWDGPAIYEYGGVYRKCDTEKQMIELVNEHLDFMERETWPE